MKKKILPRYFYSLSLLALLFLTACGGGGGSNSSGGMTQVGIKLKIPAAGNPSSSKAAHAPSPSGVAQVHLSVTDAEGRSLASTTVGVTPGQEVTITLEVPAGRARLFIIEALDSEGTLLFRGEASSDLSPDTPATITVQMVAVEAPPLPTLTLSPTSAFVLLNNSETFTATLTGLEDTRVIWSVDNVDSGNPSVGTITQTNPATYTAPATLPELSVVTVKVTSSADPTLFATATVTILTLETTVFIDDNGVDSTECGTESSPCRSITRALARANPGQTVRAASGTYDDSTETFPIRMKPGVNLIGEDVAETVITSGRSIPVAVIAADNTVLSGFTLDPNDETIDTLVRIDSGSPAITGNRFIDDRCEGICRTSHTAIEVNGGSPSISNNQFRGFGFTSSEEPITAAILVQNDAAPTIDQNTLRENRLGIALLDGAAPSIERNTITNNQTGVSVAGSAAPYLGGTTQENSGGNVLSCNTTVDLIVADTVPPFYARRNQWDHLPPTVSSQPGSGIDIVANENVDIDGATAVTPHCLTEPPTVPSGLLATAMSQDLIRLSWTASIDNFGEVTYQIERCPGTNCTSFEHIAQTTETTFDDIARSPAASYTYRVRAMDVDENLSTYSNISSTTTPDQDAPTSPSNLTANAVSETQINLSWGASADDVGVTGYRVERCEEADCNYVEIAQPTGTTFSDTALSAGTTYRYRVRAVDAAVNFSGYSNTATAVTRDTIAPTAPTNLTATAAGETQINLSWGASSDNIGVAGYRVERCQGANCTNFVEVAQPTGTTFNDTGRSAGASYTYRVRAVDAAGNFSGYSSTAGATTPDNSAPTAPTNLTAATVGETQINLSWTASSDNVGLAGYRVERCQGSNCTNFAEIGQPTATTFNDTGRSAGTAYSYRVRAIDTANNFSGFSNTATAATQDTTAPTAPANLSATAAGETQINLSWTASSDNVGVREYRVERCQGTACTNFAEIAQPTATAFNDTGRSPATAYRYRVRAVDTAGNLGGYSNIAAAVTLDTTAPTPPTNLVGNAISEIQINLSWGASSDNVGVARYGIERCQGTNCTNFAEIAQPTTATFNNTGLSAGAPYRYRVRAADAAGNLSGYSNIFTIVTLDTTAPTIPSGLSGRTLNHSEIGLSWNPSTDNVGVIGYRLERCLATGASCVEIDTGSAIDPTKPSFNDTGLATATAYTYRIRAYDAAGNLSLYSQSATASTGRILFRAGFDIGNLDQPPETTLIGDPVGDSLSLSTAAGTILVRSFVGNMDTRPVELNQIAERTGGVDLRGTVAGTPPKTGIYTARWRSLVASREVGFAAVVLRDSAGRIVASLAYRPNNILDYNDRTPSNGIGVFWRQNFAQTFEIEVDLDRKTTLLRIDGRIVMESVPFYEAAAADLARISMELGTTSAQTLAWDDIDITATVP